MTLDANPEAPLPPLADGRRWPLYVALAFAVVDFGSLAAGALAKGLGRAPLSFARVMEETNAQWIAVLASCLLTVLVAGVVARRRPWVCSLLAGTLLMPLGFEVAAAFPDPPKVHGPAPYLGSDGLGLLYITIIGLIGSTAAYLLSVPILAPAREATWQCSLDAGDTFLVRLGWWRSLALISAFALFSREIRSSFAVAPLALGAIAGVVGWIRRSRRRERLSRILRDEDQELIARQCQTIEPSVAWWVRGPVETVFEIVPRLRTDATYRLLPAQVPIAYACCVSETSTWHPAPVAGFFDMPTDVRGRG
jgi:hypothetical protein